MQVKPVGAELHLQYKEIEEPGISTGLYALFSFVLIDYNIRYLYSNRLSDQILSGLI